MRIMALVLLAAALCACEGETKPVPLDHDATPPHRVSDSEAERKAQAAIRDIEDRVASGKLPRIQFEFDKDALLPSSYPTLDLIAAIVEENDHLKLVILAHTDDIGTDEYNLDLSNRRAHSVMNYLAQHGVPPPSMRFHGLGSSKPLVKNDTDEGRATNRRVEFRVTTRDWKAVY